MTSKLISRRALEAGGLFLIGDSIRGLLWPKQYTIFWHIGPQLGRAAIEELADHPKLARSFYAAELALGIALFVSQASKDF
jgi:hypothetical protein